MYQKWTKVFCFALFLFLILFYTKYDKFSHLFVIICHKTAGKRGGQPLEGYSTWITLHVPRNGRGLPGTCAHAHICSYDLKWCRILWIFYKSEPYLGGSFPMAQIISSLIFYCLPLVKHSYYCNPQQTWPSTKKQGGLFKLLYFPPLPFSEKKTSTQLHSQHKNNSLLVMTELLSVSLPPPTPLQYTYTHTYTPK